MNSDHTAIITAVLDFWFGAPGSPDHGKDRPAWFKADPAFDQRIRERFLAAHERAAGGDLAALEATAPGCVALVVLLDQFPRNMFRGTPRAFATDADALRLANLALEKGYDRQVPPVQRKFLYLPFEHSENLADQEKCVALFRACGETENGKWAVMHRDIVARFGRFPNRNAILGRASTAEELAFLKQPGSSF